MFIIIVIIIISYHILMFGSLVCLLFVLFLKGYFVARDRISYNPGLSFKPLQIKKHQVSPTCKYHQC